MPPTCTLCSHKKRAALEREMAKGRPLRAIARQFHTSKDAIRRHRAHIQAALAKSVEAAELASASNLIGTVQGLIAELQEVKRQARRKRDGGPEVRKTVETILKGVQVLADLSGARAPRVNVNLEVHLPTLSEGLEVASQLLLNGMTTEQLRAFVEKARERLQEDVALLPAPAEPEILTPQSRINSGLEGQRFGIRTLTPASTVGDVPNGPP